MALRMAQNQVAWLGAQHVPPGMLHRRHLHPLTQPGMPLPLPVYITHFWLIAAIMLGIPNQPKTHKETKIKHFLQFPPLHWSQLKSPHNQELKFLKGFKSEFQVTTPINKM